MFVAIFHNGNLSREVRTTSIILVLKQGNEELSSFLSLFYHPISLLNVGYKILTIITSQTSVIPCWMHADGVGWPQMLHTSYYTCFSSIIYLTHQQHFSSLGAEKAFGRIEFKYVLLILQQFGFSEKLVNWISILYRPPFTAVSTNGVISSSLFLKRCMHQGCPISPVSLAWELLAAAIRQSTHIDSIQILDQMGKNQFIARW